MKKVYFDLISGASGDMLLASLIDLGVPVDFLNKQYARMPLEQITLEAKKVERSGIQCTLIDPKSESSNEYRHLHKIVDIIKAGGFSIQVFNSCEKVLDAIATAEAAVHGVDKHHIHFHEIGAVDTILDIVGVCCALEYLGVEKVEFSTIIDGHGTINSAHGVIPVPVPATACLIKGFDLKIIDIPTELLTPTGAALLVTLGTQVKNMNGRVTAVGYSCGNKVFDNHPNVLRSFLLDDSSVGLNNDKVCVLETDMDHISGEVMGHVAGLLFEKGALDVSWESIFMKKGRPAYRLTVISNPETSQLLADLIIINTRTLGVRIQNVDRVVASRSSSQVNFLEHDLTEKKCEYNGYSFSKLEYDALSALSRERQIPLLELSEMYIRQKSH